MTDKEAIAAAKAQLLELTSAFCRDHLNAEYRRLSEKLVGKLARKRPPPILRGRLENWAAGVLHALGSTNFLFDKSSSPYVSSNEIADYFGVAASTMTQKSKQIRDMFKMDRLGDQEFGTVDNKKRFAPMKDMLLQLAGMIAGESMPLDPAGFIDRDHPVIDAYLDVCERFEAQGASQSVVTALEKIIARDPDFLDPYLMLRDAYVKNGQAADAERLLDDAYARALAAITAQSGEWPKMLRWGWMENRHIIRTLLNKALSLWERGDNPAALDLLRRLLRSSPEDNIGARDYLLAIRLGMTWEGFEGKFNKGGFYNEELPEWFDKHSVQFLDEFGWWKKEVGYE